MGLLVKCKLWQSCLFPYLWLNCMFLLGTAEKQFFELTQSPIKSSNQKELSCSLNYVSSLLNVIHNEMDCNNHTIGVNNPKPHYIESFSLARLASACMLASLYFDTAQKLYHVAVMLHSLLWQPKGRLYCEWCPTNTISS